MGLKTTQESESKQDQKEDLERSQRYCLTRDRPNEGYMRPIAMILRGFVLAKKHIETLEGLLKAYEARLKTNEAIEQR